MRRQRSVVQMLRALAPSAARPTAVRAVVAASRGNAAPAQASAIVDTFNCEGGTVYPVALRTPVKQYNNVDGGRIDDGRYTNFRADVTKLVPQERVYTDPVKTFAYGTDASFYRLLPQVVVKVHDEKEVGEILPMAAKHETPVTFRAAGTSLSGQAVTDSILLKLSHTGKNFRNYEIKVRVRDASARRAFLPIEGTDVVVARANDWIRPRGCFFRREIRRESTRATAALTSLRALTTKPLSCVRPPLVRHFTFTRYRTKARRSRSSPG